MFLPTDLLSRDTYGIISSLKYSNIGFIVQSWEILIVSFSYNKNIFKGTVKEIALDRDPWKFYLMLSQWEKQSRTTIIKNWSSMDTKLHVHQFSRLVDFEVSECLNSLVLIFYSSRHKHFRTVFCICI